VLVLALPAFVCGGCTCLIGMFDLLTANWLVCFDSLIANVDEEDTAMKLAPGGVANEGHKVVSIRAD